MVVQSFDIGVVNDEIRGQIILPSPKPIFVRSSFENEESFNDDLRLSQRTDELLKEYSYAKGKEQSLIFIDAARFSDAYSLKGRYTKSGKSYEVDVRMFKGDEIIGKFQVEGEEANLSIKIIVEVNKKLNR